MQTETTTRRRDPAATRSQILETARKLFTEKGQAAVSMRDIASESGVTKSLIHHHFGTKDDLWAQVKESCLEGYFDGFMAMLKSQLPSSELLMNSVRHHFAFLRENPDIVRMFSWAQLEDEQPDTKLHAAVTSTGLRYIEEAQNNGLIRNDIDATSILVSTVGMVIHWFQGRNQFMRWRGEDPSCPQAAAAADERFIEDFVKLMSRAVSDN